MNRVHSNGEPAAQGDSTGPGWKARSFGNFRTLTLHQNEPAYHPEPVRPPGADGSPLSIRVSKWLLNGLKVGSTIYRPVTWVSTTISSCKRFFLRDSSSWHSFRASLVPRFCKEGFQARTSQLRKSNRTKHFLLRPPFINRSAPQELLPSL